MLLPRTETTAFLLQSLNFKDVIGLQKYYIDRTKCEKTKASAVDSLYELTSTRAWMSLLKPLNPYDLSERDQTSAIQQIVTTAIELRDSNLFGCVVESIDFDALDPEVMRSLGPAVLDGSMDFQEFDK